jgi:RNA polymerase sigma-70 factor, ECF subfamily
MDAVPGAQLAQAAEATVVALAMHGDTAAFSELVRRRQSWLRNLLRRLCRDAALADDLAQQVFLRAWRTVHTLRAVGAFSAWLRRLAINVWLAHRRGAAAPAESLEATPLPDPVASADASAALDLDAALAQLSADERLCIVLAYSEGMSHAEISTSAGLPLGTVKSHIRRGSERLRTLLDGYETDKGHVYAR